MRFKAGEVDSARILVDAFNSVLALASSDLLENVDAFVEAQEGEVILDLLKVAGSKLIKNTLCKQRVVAHIAIKHEVHNDVDQHRIRIQLDVATPTRISMKKPYMLTYPIAKKIHQLIAYGNAE